MKILVAGIPEADEALRRCLPGHELAFVRTMHEALAALRRGGFALVAIELHFDESRMFELLEHVRGLERYAGVPVICVQAIETGLGDPVLRSIDVAVKALGGAAFLDLRERSVPLAEHCDQRAASETLAPAKAGASFP